MGAERARCASHGLAVGPDGQCVLCRRVSTVVVSTPGEFESTSDSGSTSVDIGRVAKIAAALVSTMALAATVLHFAQTRPSVSLGGTRGLGGTVETEVDEPVAPPQPPASVVRVDPRAAALERAEALERARENVRIELYSTQWCSSCASAREYFRSSGTAFTEYDIDHDREASARLDVINPRRTIPVLVVDGARTMVGFSAPGYEATIDAAARANLN